MQLDEAELEKHWPKIQKKASELWETFNCLKDILVTNNLSRAKALGYPTMGRVGEMIEWYTGARWTLISSLFVLAYERWPNQEEQDFSVAFFQKKFQKKIIK
jgi:hypothetical protein